MLFTVDPKSLESPASTGISDELERGHIALFPTCPVPLPTPEDLEFLRELRSARLVRKNISYYPNGGRLVGMDAPAEVFECTLRILRSHSENVQRFLVRIMPRFFGSARMGTCSFRPLQEKSRNLPAHASNELVHVDAGAYGATHGDRILRFFTNIHPSEDRVWLTKGNFLELYRRHGRAAGLVPDLPSSVAEGHLGRLYSGFIRAISNSFPMARVIDTSPYDRLMRKFHNYMKDTPEFQRDQRGHREIAFAPFSSWMVLTDSVSHACISGQHALVNTFLIPLQSCRLPELAPYQILRAGVGQQADCL